MAVKRSLFVLLAFLFAIILNAYLFAQAIWSSGKQSGPLSMADRCESDAIGATQKVNPNKMLFISCGGFLD